MTISKLEILGFVVLGTLAVASIYFGLEPLGCRFTGESKGSIVYLMGCGR